MFNTGSNRPSGDGSQDDTNGAPEGAPSSFVLQPNLGRSLVHGPDTGEQKAAEARTELARYKAGLNYRRGYLDGMRKVADLFEDDLMGEEEQMANEAVRKFLEELR